MLETRRHSIRKVRIVQTAPDPLALRIRTERTLAALDLTLPGLAPGAILCVRRARDPHPLAWRAGDVNPAWVSHLRSSLSDQASRATRPHRCRLPVDANVVLFRDEAEWLACLAFAQAEGTVARDWWWGCTLGAHDLHRSWTDHATTRAQSVPAAMELLSVQGRLPTVLESMTGAAARDLARVVASVHAAGAMAAVLWSDRFTSATSDPRPVVTVSPSTSAMARETSSQPATTAATTPVRRAIQDDVPEISALAHLPVDIRVFTAIALLLARDGTRARSSAFADAIAVTFATAVETAEHAATALPRFTTDAPSAEALPRPIADPTDTPASSPKRKPRHLVDRFGEPHPPASADPSPPPPTVVTTPWTPASLEPREPFEATIDTSFGGVFYLLNVALAFDLYGDFSQPLRPGLALSPWDLVALVGRRLLRRAAIDHDDDLLWPLLARLAGRLPDQPIPDTWPAPAVWLPPEFAHAADRSLVAFIAWIADRMDTRLEQALHQSPVSVLAESARIRAGGTRLDISFSMQTHPIAVRLAGLDRDPGWLPAAGRDIRFHYA